jgi:hypothetical protein
MYMLAKLLHYTIIFGVVVNRVCVLVGAGGADCASTAPIPTRLLTYSSASPVHLWGVLKLSSCLFETIGELLEVSFLLFLLFLSFSDNCYQPCYRSDGQKVQEQICPSGILTHRE